jgi:hypothetical protein
LTYILPKPVTSCITAASKIVAFACFKFP